MPVSGGDELRDALTAMAARVRAVTPDAVEDATDVVKEVVYESLVRLQHERGTPTPSMPGEPPAKISGDLADSLTVVGPSEVSAGQFMTVMGPRTVYARIQELGGDAGRGHRSHLPERPYLRPATEAAVDDPAVREVFVRAWAAALRG